MSTRPIDNVHVYAKKDVQVLPGSGSKKATYRSRNVMKIDRAQIGMRVREGRELAGLTQAALAEVADVTTETISRLERGLYDPALATLLAVADSLRVDLDYLVGRGNGAKERPQSMITMQLFDRITQLESASQRALLRIVELIPVDDG